MELEAIGEFEEIVYPYRLGDDIDCMLEFDAGGTAEGHAVGAGIASGMTLGLAGTVAGPSVTMKYDLEFHVTNGEEQAARNRIHVESEAEFGAFADLTEVAMKHAALQNRKIAIAVAESLNSDRSAIEKICTGYSQKDGK